MSSQEVKVCGGVDSTCREVAKSEGGLSTDTHSQVNMTANGEGSHPERLLESSKDSLNKSPCTLVTDNVETPPFQIDSHLELPNPKRYNHWGKRRKSWTEEMFRCQFTDEVHGTKLVCNHLLWKNRPQDLRDHLSQHLELVSVTNMTDAQVAACYKDAARIIQPKTPEDEDQDINQDIDDECS